MKRKLTPAVYCLMVAFALGAVLGNTPYSLLGTRGTASAMSVSQLAPLAPAGTGFSYQGRLLNAGAPVTGAHDFTFKLFDALSSGNQVGTTLTLTNQTVTNGIFTVSLDFGDTAFIGDARWLETAVRVAGVGSFVTLTPRQPITPSPYALSAPWFGISTKPDGYSPNRLQNDGTIVDSTNDVGRYTAVTIGVDGLPFIAYQEVTNLDLKVAHCDDVACNSRTITTLDSTGDTGYTPAVTQGPDGMSLVSYHDNTNGDLKVAHCSNVECTSATITAIDTAGDVGMYSSMTVNGSGRILISYQDVTNLDLKVAACNNPTCTTAQLSTLDSVGSVGTFTSITRNYDGNGLISYYDSTNGNLKLAYCGDATCSAGSVGFLPVDSTGLVGQYSSIALGRDGLPLISYFDNTNDDLKVAHCNNDICSSITRSTLDSTGSVGTHTSIAIGSDGLGMISYYDITNGDLKTAHCTNVVCTGAVTHALRTTGDVGLYSSIAIGVDGLPIITDRDDTFLEIESMHCGSPACISYMRRR